MCALAIVYMAKLQMCPSHHSYQEKHAAISGAGTTEIGLFTDQLPVRKCLQRVSVFCYARPVYLMGGGQLGVNRCPDGR